MNELNNESNSESKPMWQGLDDLQRRVLGVLIEKAKTTPESYPLTVNAIKTGSNQKSNRNPQMDLAADDVMATLDELREMGAVVELQGDGRVSKYRHKAYEWLGVEKTELAVITELMLRGEQTIGELRGRAARMEPIESLSELKPVLNSLKEKGLLVEVTPPGRGQIVTHGLYKEGFAPPTIAVSEGSDAGGVGGINAPAKSPGSIQNAEAPSQANNDRFDELQKQLDELRARVKLLEEKLA